jgi:hypothetical protein
MARKYFVNEAMEELEKGIPAKGSRLTASFSSVGVLMPGRKPSAKGRKRSGRNSADNRAKEKGA